jgi:hypothetical protein
MVEGEHYGKIPGCGDKPTLYKAGGEVLATTFGLAPTFDIRRSDMANGHREYEITCTLTHIATGAIVGAGVGCCSTMESKYRWRNGDRKCPNCGKPAIIKGKAEYGGGWVCFARKGGCGSKWQDGSKEIEGQETGRIENPDIADVYNTILKMAKKRAQVDCTLTAVGASDILTQDLEDLGVSSQQYPAPPPVERPQSRPVPPTEEAQLASSGDLREIELGRIKKVLNLSGRDTLPKSEMKELMLKYWGDKAKSWAAMYRDVALATLEEGRIRFEADHGLGLPEGLQ